MTIFVTQRLQDDDNHPLAPRINPSVTHRLLLRQLKRHIGDPTTLPLAWQNFIAAINDAYVQADDDRKRLERTLELNSQELLEANAQMQVLLQSVEQQVQERTAELQTALEFAHVLKGVTDQIRSSLDLNVILQTIVQEVRSLLNTDRVVVYQFDANYQGRVVVEALQGNWVSTLGDQYNDVCFPLEYAERYLEQGRVRIVSNVAQSTLSQCHIDFLQHIQVKANIVVPIQIGKQLWGLLIVHACQQPREWKSMEVELLQQLAAQAAIAIHQAELYEHSRQTADANLQQSLQLKQALQDLRKTQAQLIQTEKMSSLGQLVAGVAHEINNPMNFIHGNLNYANQYASDLLSIIDLYQRYYPDPHPEIQRATETLDLEFLIQDFSRLMSSMKVGSERIRQIVLSLRNFSRMDEAEMKAVNIHDGIESTLLILQHRLQTNTQHGPIQIDKLYQNLPPVECYAGQLNQVFMNVLANAIDALEETSKFAACQIAPVTEASFALPSDLPSAHLRERWKVQDTPTIWIQTEQTQPGWVTIHIIDNGPGITQATIQRLFDPFFTTKPVGSGTGLGLSISYQIITERHHGSLSCFSVPGVGSQFTIAIPVTPSQSLQPSLMSGSH